MIIQPNIANFLVRQRQRFGLTQEELAYRSGVSVRTIRNIETKSIARPRSSTIRLMLSALCQVPDDSNLHGDAPGELECIPSLLDRLSGGGEVSYGDISVAGPIIGRARECESISASLRSQRLVALVGPGGVGKTKLARTIADRVSSISGTPSEFIDLRAVAARSADEGGDLVDSLHQLVRSQIGARLATGGAEVGLSQLLVILDGAEHFAESISRLADDVTRSDQRVQVLMTSRCQLPGSSAQSWEIAPLESSSPAAGARSIPAAAQLFLSLASSACPSLDLGRRLDEVIELCRRLGGLPLAIELAALRIRSISIDILLDDGPSLRLLDEAAANRLPRDRSVSACLQASYGLLDHGHQRLLWELSEISGCFTADDVMRRCVGDRSRMLGVLADLVDCSLVRLDRGNQYVYSLQPFVAEFVQSVSEHRAPHVPALGLAG